MISFPPSIIVNPGRDRGSSFVSLAAEAFMLLNYPIPVVGEEWAVSENDARRRLEVFSGVLSEGLEKPCSRRQELL